MPTYSYDGQDSAGKKVAGKIKANSDQQAQDKIRKMNLRNASLTKLAESERKGLFGGPPKAHVKLADLVVFTRQFATMISSGIPVLECLSILQEQATDKGFAWCLSDIIHKVESGSDLSNALGEHPRVFEKIYVNMIKAGEASGQLDSILLRLADFQEASQKLKREIKSAMTYPIISLVMILGISGFLMVFIVPKFKKVFDDLGVELPAPTKAVMATSNFLETKAIWLALGIIVAVVSIIMYKKTENGSYQWDWLILKTPIFGDLFKKVAVSRFARTFSTLVKSGVPILGALEIVSATSGNKVLEKAVNNARDSIRQGEPLAKPLAEEPIFPPMVVRMIAIGEKSGALEQLLGKIADFYDEQVSASVEALTSMIEPLMIGVMGFVVGGIVLAIFLPIFKMQESLSKK